MTTTTRVNFRPMGDRVLVKPMQQEERTKGGVILPDTAKEKPQQGEIIAVGTGKMLDNGQMYNMTLKVGNKVLYGKYSGNEIKIDGEEYLIIKENEIYGIIE